MFTSYGGQRVSRSGQWVMAVGVPGGPARNPGALPATIQGRSLILIDGRRSMLENIDTLLSGELLKPLDAMGHGDRLARVDRNYPEPGPVSGNRRWIHWDLGKLLYSRADSGQGR